MPLSVTALYVSLSALLMLVYAWGVVRIRKREKIGLGSADNKALEIAMRVHGNFLEYAPMFLLLLACAEMNGLSALYLHVMGAAWLVARVLHGIGLSHGRGGYHPGRFYGTLITWLLICAAAVINLGLWVLGAPQ
ncbi:MAPEG family protein [Shewanella khirikhana]|uniref:Inner membrane protein YecN n=1 Tax=Shewanella khirikhana TaxID=1965282 RepID=A0ABN5TYN2_9GAMM|nr:MAPEG family protein [Shewanella khirikhana]AZQ12341.1 Inner membrane protein YecN [Shewanella khirikhana]